ncbi:MAG: polyamine aminopropyltransferase [Candidatus Magasanikbacteria bacterium]|jgi:spermidine synthase|nr:polyamine aminopropyltransferase [Candidatus Magasanikbacteria bacterium]
MATKRNIENESKSVATIFATVFIIAACGIFYELLISTLSSYVLGSSVLQFSLTIGLFLFFMGIGSYLSRFVRGPALDRFIAVELVIGIVGGLSVLLLSYAYAIAFTYIPIVLLLIACISICIGLEIPLVMRVLKPLNVKEGIAQVLSFDYIGALIASVLFPLVCLPYLGIMRTAFLVGVINLVVAGMTLRFFHKQIKSVKLLSSVWLVGMLVLVAGLVYSPQITSYFDSYTYQDHVIYSHQSPYQKIVLTKFKDDVRLYLNGSLQFSAIDEARYHEALVHVPMRLVQEPKHVLILGGGDGLAAREVLKYLSVESITVVDLDPEVTTLAKEHPMLTDINKFSLLSAKVLVRNEDAFVFVQEATSQYDVVIIDLPDPSDFSVGKLYAKEFYQSVERIIAPGGVLVTQASSPFFARRPYWMVHHTLESVFDWVDAYSLQVPSFGPWGFHVAASRPHNSTAAPLTVSTTVLTGELVESMFIFSKDVAEIDTDIHTLVNQRLVHEYEDSWKYFYE